ncbi:MAG: serine hydrolase [Bacteroidota bacterium]
MEKLYLVFLLAFSSMAAAQDIYFPPLTGDTWETVDPASLNFCQSEIDSLYAFLDEEQTNAFLLLKDGRIVLEQYFDTYGVDSLGPWFSAGKSLMATLVGIAQEENLLDINAPTSTYLGSNWTSMPANQEDAITVWHQLTMTSGLEDSDFVCWDPVCLTYLADPGTRWSYHNAPYSLLRNVLESATGQTLNQYTFSKINLKTGMSGFWIPAGFNNYYLSNARDMARFGIMIQNGGFWNTTPVLNDPVYLDAMLNTSQSINLSYGYLWWLNGQNSFIPPGLSFPLPGPIAPEAPADVVTAAGSQGQYVSFSPSSGLLMIRQGDSNDNDLAAITLINDIWKRIGGLDCTVTSAEAPTLPEVSIFPNPASDQVWVEGFDSESFTLSLFSPSGRWISSVENQDFLDVSGLAAGLYLLQIETDAGRLTRKLILD